MSVQLRVILKSFLNKVPLELEKSCIIGRSSKSQLQIDEDNISSQHCRLTLKKDHLEIEDLESKNGTYLNGLKINKATVFVGDEIRLGKVIITIDTETLDEQWKNVLTYNKFSKKERVEQELKVEVFHREHPKPELLVRDEIRNPIRSVPTVDLEDIHENHKLLSFLSSVINYSILIILIIAPLIFVLNFLTEMSEDYQIIIVTILELAFMTLYYVVNYRLLKLTIGEKLSGIERIYKKHN